MFLAYFCSGASVRVPLMSPRDQLKVCIKRSVVSYTRIMIRDSRQIQHERYKKSSHRPLFIPSHQLPALILAKNHTLTPNPIMYKTWEMIDSKSRGNMTEEYNENCRWTQISSQSIHQFKKIKKKKERKRNGDCYNTVRYSLIASPLVRIIVLTISIIPTLPTSTTTTTTTTSTTATHAAHIDPHVH